MNGGQQEPAARRRPSVAPPCSTPDCSQVTQVSRTYPNQTGPTGTEDERASGYSSKGKVTVLRPHLSRGAAVTELNAGRLRRSSGGAKLSLSCKATATLSTGPKVREQRQTLTPSMHCSQSKGVYVCVCVCVCAAPEMASCVRSGDCAAGLCCVRYLTGRRCQRIPVEGEACLLRGFSKLRRKLGRCDCDAGLACTAVSRAESGKVKGQGVCQARQNKGQNARHSGKKRRTAETSC